MARKRRTQWIDSLATSEIAVAGAAAPGTINEQVLVDEAEIENVGGAATVTRIVGSITLQRTLGSPVLSIAIWLGSAFVGAANPTDWDQDTYQRSRVLWTYQTLLTTDPANRQLTVDIRTQRKLGQGVALQMSVQNHSIANHNAEFTFHLRSLLLL